MTIITVQVKPTPGDVAHVIAVVEAGSHAKEKQEPIKRELEVHEGTPNTFDFEIADDQRLILESTVTGKLTHDLAQGVVSITPLKAPEPKAKSEPHAAAHAAPKKKDAA